LKPKAQTCKQDHTKAILKRDRMNEETSQFSAVQKEILRIVQDNLPDSPTPFADIASSLEVSEGFVIDFLLELKDKGYIRRFGATLRHQEAGYDCNVMVAWEIPPDEDIDSIAEIMVKRSEISHCYKRKSNPDWPFNLYTMIHAQSEQDCEKIVKEIQSITGLQNYELLFSDRELKKTSMRYF